ncbi:MAG: hypothetical protein IPK60_02125 [Sandaracinaceae bacterium]|nr:hypothetical protein [Sandaracinaceae bacterium]
MSKSPASITWGRVAITSLVSLVVAATCVVAWSGDATAGSSGSSNLFRIVGSGSADSFGDYVSESTDLDTYYSFFVEVPSGLGSLQIDIFDADVLVAGGSHDLAVTGSNTRVRYRVINPAGTTVFNERLNAQSCGTIGGGTCDNTWANILTQASPTAGHWEVRVDQSSAQTTGGDINGFGIRAHDGTPGAGGTELNIYAPSFVPLGVIAAGSAAYSLYPWVHSGCDLDAYDFDTDRNTNTGNSWTFADRTSAFTASLANANLSKNAQWRTNSITGFTSTQEASGYGIWPSTFTIAATGGNTYNLNTIYLGRYSYTTPAGTPPSAQPEASTARIYLPTDAAGAPVEPYMEQFVGHRSGTNPITKNTTTRLELTVRVYNPTAQSITISGTYGGNAREVRVNVPSSGGFNVYRGNATVTQGSVTSAPALGGTGTIRWQPGTIVAGGNAAISYRIDTTPTTNPAYAITGAETSMTAGTLALYLDQTGNTTQAASNTYLGTLCPLTEQRNVSVFAAVANVTAVRHGDLTTVEWDTTSELGTTGFVVERMNARGDFERIHEGYIPSLLDSVQGGHYAVVDHGTGEGTLAYLISDIDYVHREVLHGPFYVQARHDRTGLTREMLRVGYERSARAWPTTGVLQSTADRPFNPLRRASSEGVDAVHVAVTARGMHRIDATALAQAFGLSESDVISAIGSGSLALSLMGAPVAWTRGEDARSLVFFANHEERVFTRETIYRLARAAGMSMEHSRVAAAHAYPTAVSFQDTAHFEEEAFPGTSVSPDPDSDYWYWKTVSSLDAAHSTQEFELNLPTLATTAEPARISVRGFGITDNPHLIHVQVNGFDAGLMTFARSGVANVALAFDAALLREGSNTVALVAERVGTVDSSVYIDSIDVTYPRTFAANDSQLTFATPSATTVRVDGFRDGAVGIFDVTVANEPRIVDGAEVATTSGVTSFGFDAAAGTTYAAATPQSLQSPSRVWADHASSLRDAANAAQYIIITTEVLHDEAVRLANTRITRGFSALVVDVEDIYDEFNFGAPNPHAIQTFLAYANSSWGVTPRYVLLAGTSTFDFRDALGLGGNLVPPLMLRTAHGLFPADSQYVDFNHDGAPDAALGRLPVRNAAEMATAVDKIIAYESGEPSEWTDRVLLLTDATSDNGFTDTLQAAAAALPERVTTQSIDLSDSDIADARVELASALAEGVFAVNYVGHGGTDRLSDQGLLNMSDASALTNADRLPIVTAASCLVAGFGMPGFGSIGEALVQNPRGGAIAVWSPSAITEATSASVIANRTLSSILSGERRPLGDAVLSATRLLAARGFDGVTLATFSLLGDPALEIQNPRDVLPPREPGVPLDVPPENGGVAPSEVPPGVQAGCYVSLPSHSDRSLVGALGLIALTWVLRRRNARAPRCR